MQQRVISAGIIIFRRTEEGIKFLILYHGRNYWNFPKGKIESEEKSSQTALREVEEETGLKADELKFVGNFKTHERFFYQRGKDKIYKIVILYLAETRQRKIIASSKEHEGYGWFTYAEAKKILSKHPGSVAIINKAYAFLRNCGSTQTARGFARNTSPAQARRYGQARKTAQIHDEKKKFPRTSVQRGKKDSARQSSFLQRRRSAFRPASSIPSRRQSPKQKPQT